MKLIKIKRGAHQKKTIPVINPESATWKSMVGSAISLVVCCALFIGTTLAWYMDSVDSDVGSITVGSLSIGFWNGQETDETKQTTAKRSGKDTNGETVNYTLDWSEATGYSATNPQKWEPGLTKTLESFRLENLGELDLYYKLAFTGVTQPENTAEKTYSLSDSYALLDSLQFYLKETKTEKDSNNQETTTVTYTPIDLYSFAETAKILSADTIASDDTVNHPYTRDITVVCTMDENAPQSTMGTGIKNLTLTAYATQTMDSLSTETIFKDTLLAKDLDSLTKYLNGYANQTADGKPITVVLTEDVTLTDTLTVANGANVPWIVLDLNGHTITGAANKPVFSINSGARLIIKDSTRKDADNQVCYGAVILTGTAGVTVTTGEENGTQTATADAAMYMFDNQGYLEITGGSYLSAVQLDMGTTKTLDDNEQNGIKSTTVYGNAPYLVKPGTGTGTTVLCGGSFDRTEYTSDTTQRHFNWDLDKDNNVDKEDFKTLLKFSCDIAATYKDGNSDVDYTYEITSEGPTTYTLYKVSYNTFTIPESTSDSGT